MYQKNHSQPQPATLVNNSESLQAMTSAVTKMAEVMKSSKPSASNLERLPVPSWDGSRRSYPTWKREFNHWMEKFSQEKDEQLQRFRKALPKDCWWTEQVKTCRTIDQAWEILDIEFADKRKMMDELLSGINNLKPIKDDSKSLTKYATQIARFVNDMEDNGCNVTTFSEAPFFMSQLLSKLDPKDNAEFGREMKRNKMDETVTNLVQWLHEEANLRSRGNQEHDTERLQRRSSGRRSENHASDVEEPNKEDQCPFGCKSKHFLAACPLYQSSTVDQRWEVVKKNQRCRKCLALHHTKKCKKPDGTTCNSCKKNHHRSLHNEKKKPNDDNQDPRTPKQESNNHVNIDTSSQISDKKIVTGLLPVQKVKVNDSSGSHTEIFAMLDSGSNTSLLSKSAAKKLGLSGPHTHLTMSLAGGGQKSEKSQILDVKLISHDDENVEKPLLVHTVSKPCSNAKSVSKKSLEKFDHLLPVFDKLHLSGENVDLLLGTDFIDWFVDIQVIPGGPNEPIAKMNCFGWYTIGQLSPNEESVQSVDVGTMSVKENIEMILEQDQLGVKPTKLCTCTDNELKENNFIRSLYVTDYRLYSISSDLLRQP